MISENVISRSIAMVLLVAAPYAISATAQLNAGLSPNAAAELLFQLDTLQQEVQSLRGQLEEQNHELNQMKNRQKDRYIDLDKRISLLMTSASNPVTTSPVASVPTVSDVSNQQVEQQASPVVSEQPQEVVAQSSPVIALIPVTEQSQTAYNNAYNLIKERKFSEAQAAFSRFVIEYPNNSLTGNGYYWLGELKLVQGNTQEALIAFQTVVQDFSGHNKEQDALYKLGIITDQLGDSAGARSYFQDVIQRFPKSKAAKLSTSYLSKLK